VVIGNGNVAATSSHPRAPLPTARADRHRRPRPRGAAREQCPRGRRARPPRSRPGAFTERRAARGSAPRRRRQHVDPADAELDAVSREWLAAEGTFTARKNVELLQAFAAAPPDAGAARRIDLRFLCSPVEIRARPRRGVDVRRNAIVP
jgi:hypothetical protein